MCYNAQIEMFTPATDNYSMGDSFKKKGVLTHLLSIIRGRYRRWPPMNSRMMDVGGIAEISSGDRATM